MRRQGHGGTEPLISLCAALGRPDGLGAELRKRRTRNTLKGRKQGGCRKAGERRNVSEGGRPSERSTRNNEARSSTIRDVSLLSRSLAWRRQLLERKEEAVKRRSEGPLGAIRKADSCNDALRRKQQWRANDATLQDGPPRRARGPGGDKRAPGPAVPQVGDGRGQQRRRRVNEQAWLGCEARESEEIDCKSRGTKERRSDRRAEP